MIVIILKVINILDGYPADDILVTKVENLIRGAKGSVMEDGVH
jgi:hypothetical protein